MGHRKTMAMLNNQRVPCLPTNQLPSASPGFTGLRWHPTKAEAHGRAVLPGLRLVCRFWG